MCIIMLIANIFVIIENYRNQSASIGRMNVVMKIIQFKRHIYSQSAIKGDWENASMLLSEAVIKTSHFN